MSEEDEDLEPEEECRQDIAAAVEYGEKFEACQVTVRKVQAARRLIELAGGYKEAIILADAVWFVALESDDANTGASNVVSHEDETESECGPDYEVYEARTRKVMAAEKLLQLASGCSEAFLLLDAVVLAKHGNQGYEQIANVRGAAACYHGRVAEALRRKNEGE